jgi:hypothetical protein
MLASFKLKTNELNNALKLLKVSLKLKASNKLDLMCEVTIKNGQIDLCVPGVVQIVNCETDGTAKFVIPYLQLEFFVKSFKKREMDFTLFEGELICENSRFAIETTFFKDDNILRSIDLPLNYTIRDLLDLSEKGFTSEELEFNNIPSLIENEKQRLWKELKKDGNALSKFKIKHEVALKLFNVKKLPFPKTKFTEKKSGTIKGQFRLFE